MNLPPIVESILKSGAPTLLTGLLLPPPFNILASTLVTGAIKAFLPPDVDATPLPMQPAGALPPTAVVATVAANAGNPDFLSNLREAEFRLQQYEAESGRKFAELANEDRASARSFQVQSGNTKSLLLWGMGILAISLISLLAVVIAAILMISGAISINPVNLAMAQGWFMLIGTIIGYIANQGSQITSFYWGSSQSSKEKDESLSKVLADQGSQIGESAAAQAEVVKQAAARPIIPIAPIVPVVPPVVEEPVRWMQGQYGGTRWQVTKDGILDEGETAIARTVGEPETVRRIWKDFGNIIKTASLEHGVPIEIIVMTIAVESRGRVTAMLTEPDGRQSVGLMQTLI